MLNEKLEYDIYSSVFHYNQAVSSNIIKYRLLNEGLSGMKHILEIVARGKIDESPTFDFTTIENHLVLWLEHFKQETLKSICANDSDENGLDYSSQKYDALYWKISSLQGTGKHNPFRLDENFKNAKNKILFKSIVADAYEAGPLKEYVLLAKQNPFLSKDDSYVQKAKKNNTFAALSDGEIDYLLKLTATFLIEQKLLSKKNIETTSIHITNANILNWASVQKNETNFVFGPLYQDKIGKPLYIKVPVTNSEKSFKIKFDFDWLDNFLIVSIADHQELSSHSKKYHCIYKDNGLGVPLQPIPLEKIK